MRRLVAVLIVVAGCGYSRVQLTYPTTTVAFDRGYEQRRLLWELRKDDVVRVRLELALKVAQG